MLVCFLKPTSHRAQSSYLAQEEQLCLATAGALQSQVERTDSDGGRVLSERAWSLTETLKCRGPGTAPHPKRHAKHFWSRTLGFQRHRPRNVKKTLAPPRDISGLSTEFEVNLNRFNPKINYAYPQRVVKIPKTSILRSPRSNGTVRQLGAAPVASEATVVC